MTHRLDRRTVFSLTATIAVGMPFVAISQEVFDPPAERSEFSATRLTDPISIDGNLDEQIWHEGTVISGFVQKEPSQQSPATHKTAVRIAYDDDALYIAAICYQPRDTIRVQNLQRDFSFDENDLFGIAIDGFGDQRNAVVFQTTPYGNQRDLEVIDGSELNVNWDARWTVRTRVHDDRWIAEIAIPWRNLRYPTGADQMGVIFARNVRGLNEETSLPAVPRAFSVGRMAYAGDLQSFETPPPSPNVQLNPYVLTERGGSTGSPDGSHSEVGGELKWAISPNTVLDVTINTDFAQADVDRSVINLDRFSVFFPERRQFFLENANIFTASVTEWIRPFFSRRIGLDVAGNAIPLDGGLRLTSRSADQQLGLLAMRQQSPSADSSSLFAVSRYSRNLAAQSRIGGMLTYRRDDGLTQNDNVTYTADGLWQPTQSFGIQGMLSRSVDGATGDGLGGQLWAFYRSNHLYVGSLNYYSKDYNPGIGLELLDTNYLMNNLTISADWRPAELPSSVRRLNPGISIFSFRSSDDSDLLFAYASVRPVRVEFQSGARVDVVVEPNRQRLQESFSPAGIGIAPGTYDYTRYRVSGTTDQSAKWAGDVSVESGEYFNGKLTNYSASARFVPSRQFELSADYELNRIRSLGVLAEDATTRLYRINARVALNPRFQMTGFYQWDSLAERSAWNFRMSWEFRPLSYLYLVYNKNERDALNADDSLSQDQLIIKATYLFET